jgi:membrane-bound ClpP family serine protease
MKLERLGKTNKSHMDILFDPNIAYLLVVSTFLLLWSSYASPGTGIIEAAALIALILSGWAMFVLPINLWALGLLLLVIFPVVAYRATQRMVFLILAILMLEVGSVFIFAGEDWRPIVNPFLAIIVSAGTGFYYWLSTTKIIEAERNPLAHNPDAHRRRTVERPQRAADPKRQQSAGDRPRRAGAGGGSEPHRQRFVVHAGQKLESIKGRQAKKRYPPYIGP